MHTISSDVPNKIITDILVVLVVAFKCVLLYLRGRIKGMFQKENLPEKLTSLVPATAVIDKLTHFHVSILGNYKKLV